MTTLEKVCDRVASMARSHHDKMISVDDVSFNDLETVYIFPLESDQAPDFVVGDLLDPGVEGLGLDPEILRNPLNS